MLKRVNPFHSSELGTGWGLAILNSEEELHFIYSRQLQLEQAQYFGVGGSMRANSFSYSDYLPSNEGEVFFKIFGAHMCTDTPVFDFW